MYGILKVLKQGSLLSEAQPCARRPAQCVAARRGGRARHREMPQRPGRHTRPAPSKCFPGGKAPARNAGDPGSVPALGRAPREGNGNSLQHTCLENPTDRGSLQVTVHVVTKNQTQLSN